MKKIFSIIILVFLVLLTSCNWDIYSNKFMDYGAGTGTVNSKRPFSQEKPDGLIASKGTYSGRIQVAWDGILNADYYEVMRSTEEEAGYIFVGTVTSPSFSDSNVEPGQEYFYKIRARSNYNISTVGALSDAVSGWSITYPANLNAEQGKSTENIKITWDKVKNVRGYIVQYSDSIAEGTWKYVTPSGSSQTEYIYNPETLQALYSPTSQESGKSLNFRICSVSKSGEKSAESFSVIGYTRVEGAPPSPSNFKAEKGTSTSIITLTWDTLKDPDGGEYEWEIRRSADGGNELTIYSTENGDEPPVDDNGVMSFVDENALIPGVEYKYTIIAKGMVNGSLVNGTPSVDTGYLLSPPTVIEEAYIDDNNNFVFTFASPVCDTEGRNLEYRVYGKVESSDSYTLINTFPLNGSESYTFHVPYEENRYQFFDIRVYDIDRDLESAGSESVIGHSVNVPAPVKPVNFNASSNYYDASISDLVVDGRYPVVLSFDTDENAIRYDVEIYDESGSKKIADIENAEFTVSASDGLTRIIVPQEYSPEVGVKYSYKVKGIDKLGREGMWSDMKSGYSAITSSELIKYMQVFSMKPWEYIDKKLLGEELSNKWRNSKIYTMVAAAGLNSLGSASENGNASGEIKYSANAAGIGGHVVFTFTDFGEKTFMSTTGSYSMDVDTGGTGSCTGSITVKGMYPAKIGFGNISVSSQKFVGTYTVTQDGRNSEEVSPNQQVN